MNIRLETITPSLAAEYLTHAGTNRRLQPTRVTLFAEMMLAGHWRLTHQGIAFDRHGTLRDGQHRLHAIVKSGCTIQMWVARDMEDDAVINLDAGKSRDVADSLTISGFPTTKTAVAIARAMVGRGTTPKHHRMDADDMRAFLTVNADAIAFVTNATSKTKGVGHSCVRGCMATAWWTVDRGRLATFRDQLGTGIVEDSTQDGAVVRLRDWLLSTNGIVTGSEIAREEVFRKTETALLAYLEYRPLSKLYIRKEPCFLLPMANGQTNGKAAV